MNRMAPSKVVVDPMDPKYAGDHEGSLVYLAANPPPLSAAITVAPPEVEEARYSDTWTVFIFFRLANAIALSTFFQPDEYYQALEPAWQLAFGADSGAWITWVSPAPGLVNCMLTCLILGMAARASVVHSTSPSCWSIPRHCGT